MASHREMGDTPQALRNEHISNGREAIGEGIAPATGGFAASVSDLRVSAREVIGGIEVVPAEIADRLLMGMAQMVIAHDRWRIALLEDQRSEEGDPNRKTLRNRVKKRRMSYRSSRYACRRFIEEASGLKVSSMTTAMKHYLTNQCLPKDDQE